MLPHLQGSFDQSRLASHNAIHTFPVNFNTTGISSGVKVGTFRGASATKPIILRVGVLVTTAFNAATTNVLTVGTTSAANEWIDQSNVAEGTVGTTGPRTGGMNAYSNIAAATTTGAITQYTVAAGSAAGVVSPVTPRNVVLTITDANASITAISITVTGTNTRGEVMTEDFTFASFTTLVATGSKAFATVTAVAVNSVTGAGGTDKLDMGYGTKIGVMGGPGSTVYKEVLLGTGAETLGTVSTTNGTVIMATAPDGTRDYELYYYTESTAVPLTKTFRITAATDLYVKYTQTGTAATTGRAVVVVDEFEENVTSIL